MTEMIYLSAVGMVNALGNSADEIAANLIAGVAPGMRQRAGWLQGLPEAVLGGVEGDLPPVPGSFSAHRSRNNHCCFGAARPAASMRPLRAWARPRGGGAGHQHLRTGRG
ncbi:MAG: hypothetical protein ACLR9W_05775 [Enterobacter hormaechei]